MSALLHEVVPLLPNGRVTLQLHNPNLKLHYSGKQGRDRSHDLHHAAVCLERFDYLWSDLGSRRNSKVVQRALFAHVLTIGMR